MALKVLGIIMIEINKIYNSDCIELMNKIDYGIVDLTVTSPPYNVKMEYAEDETGDDLPYPEYLKWLEDVFSEVYRITKSGGRLCINVGDLANGRIPLSSDIVGLCRDIGWLPFARIVWDKTNTSNRFSWGSWMSPNAPSFPNSVEYILIFAKDRLSLDRKGVIDIEKQEFIDWTLNMWRIGAASHPVHKAVFPITIPIRLIKMLTYVGDLVFEPFTGVGTTELAALKTNRNFIGSEKSKIYFDIAEEAINNELQQYKLF